MTKKNVTSEISDEEFNKMIGMDYPRTGTGKDTEASILTDYGEITTPKLNPQSDNGEKKTKPESTVERAGVVANAVSAARAASLATGLTMATEPAEPTEPTEPTDEPTGYIPPVMPSIISPDVPNGFGNTEISNDLFAPAMSCESGIPKVPSVPTAITSPDAPKLSSTVNTPVAPELSSTVTVPATPDRQSEMTAPTAQEPLRRPSSKQRKASFDEYREAFLRAPKISDRQPVFLSRETRDRLDEIVRKLGDRKMSVSGMLENIARQHLESYAEDIEVWKRM